MSRPERRIPRRAASLLLAALAAVGCQTVPAGEQQTAPATPSSAKPGRLAMTVSDFTDTNINSYRDAATVAVYVYAHNYPIPMRARGRFEFQLFTRDGQPLTRWEFDEKQTAAVQYELAPGPGFIFELSLLKAGTDELDASEGEMVCTFWPKDGPPLRTRPSGPIQIGRLGRRSPGQSEPAGR